MHSPQERMAATARKAAGVAAPKIYYLHPLLAGPLSAWEPHIERCRRMGFDHVATAPLFAPGGSGDVFLTGDPEAVHPVLGTDAPADEVVATLAQMCARHGVRLILDIVLDRVASDGAL